MDIEDRLLYEYSRPELKERTRRRLREISELGMEIASNESFYKEDIIGGLWIEYVWHFSDEEFNGYIGWIKGVINGKKE